MLSPWSIDLRLLVSIISSVFRCISDKQSPHQKKGVSRAFALFVLLKRLKLTKQTTFTMYKTSCLSNEFDFHGIWISKIDAFISWGKCIET